MDPAALSIQDRKIMEMFNRAAPWFDMMERTLGRIFFHRFLDVRREAMGLLDAQPGMAVLEVGIGTGSNMRYMPKGTQCFGTDFCPGMLMRCSRNMARQSLHVPLTRSLASALPYADRAFDVVFHVGAFNFLSDKAGTLAEMTRVAKPGGLIMVVDETYDCAKHYHTQCNNPATRYAHKSVAGAIALPTGIMPGGITDVNVTHLFKERVYAVRFRKLK